MISCKANILLVLLSMGGGLLWAQTDLIISEYLENGAEKCIEIHNPTNASIALADYRISIWNNGATTRETLRNLAAAGSLAPGATILSCRSAGSISSIPAAIDFATGFTGNDAVAITKGPTNDIVDLFGNIGCDPGVYSEGGNTTENVILRRHACVVYGIVSDPPGNCPFPALATEWTSFSPSAIDDLGSHNALSLSITSVIGRSPMDCSAGTGSIAVVASGLINGEDYQLTYTRNGALLQEEITAVGDSLQLLNLVAASYSDFSVGNLSGSCTSAVDGTIIEITTPEYPTNVSAIPIQPSSCGGNGTINVSANGINLQYAINEGAWQTTGTFLLPQGEYQVTVRSSSAPLCVTPPETVILSDPEAPMIAATPTDPTCGATGSITLSGAIAGKEYFVEWFDPARFFINRLPASGNDLIIENLPAGSYTDIRVIDQSTFCESNTLTGPVVLDAAEGLTIGVTGMDPSSCGANGTITISGLEAGSSYDLSYEKDGGEVLLEGLPALGGNLLLRTPTGYYTNFLVTEVGTSCGSNPFPDTIILSDQSGLVISAVAESPTRCGENGSLTISGLSPGSSYNIEYIENGDSVQQLNVPTQGAEIVLSLGAGAYRDIQVYDVAGGCPSNLIASNYPIEEPEAPTISVSSRAPLKCGGDATLIIEGLIGDEIYHLTYDYNSEPNALNNLTAGSTSTIEVSIPTGAYRNVQVTHVATGCPSNLLVGITNVFDLEAPSVSVSGQNPMTCGSNDGLLRILGLTSGTLYDLTYDSNGTITQLINVEATNNQIILPVSAGTYTNVQVTDPQTECRSNLIFYQIILTAPGATIDIAGSDPTICGGEGILTISNLDQNGIYDVVFDQDAVAQSRRVSSQDLRLNLLVPAGEYTNVQVTEISMGCSSNRETDVVTISNGDELAPVIEEVIVSEQSACGGSVDLTINAIGDNLEYSIDGGDSWSLSPAFAMLRPDDYQVAIQVLGSNNCLVGGETFSVPGGSLPVINDVEIVPIEHCDGAGTIVVDATGDNLLYSIDGGDNWVLSNTFQDLPGDTYEVAVQESGFDLCIANSGDIVFESPLAPEINSVIQKPIESCNGRGNLAINANGLETGRSYRLDLVSAGTEMQINLVAQSNMMLMVTGLAGGLYRNLQLHDQITTCASNVVSEVNVAGALEATLAIDSMTNPSSCTAADGEIFLLVNEPDFEYVVDVTINGEVQPSSAGISNADSIIPIAGLTTGTYSIMVSFGDCVSTIEKTVLSAADSPELQIDNILAPISCGSETGGIRLRTPEAGETYLINYFWNGAPVAPLSRLSDLDSTISIENLPGGNYTNITISFNECSSAGVNTVLLDPPLVPQLITTPNSSCEENRGSIGLQNLEPNTTYGLSYDSLGILIDRPVLSNPAGAIFIDNLASGFYRDIVLSAGICSSDTIKVAEITGQGALGTFEPIPISPTTCGGSDGRIIFDSLEPMANVSATYLFNGMLMSIDDGMADDDGVFQITGLSAGSIEGLRLSFDGCSTSSVDLDLEDPSLGEVAIEVTSAIACGGGAGSFLLNGLQPGENYDISYTIEEETTTVPLPSNGAGEVLVENLQPGGYSQIRAGLNGCFSNTFSALILSEGGAPTFSITNVIDPTGCGTADGAFVLSDLGTNQTYEVSLTVGGIASDFVSYESGANGQVLFNGLSAGVYGVVVAIDTCVSESQDTMLAAAGGIELVTNVEEPTSCAANDGALIFEDLTDGISYTIIYDSLGDPALFAGTPSDGILRIENLGVGQYGSITVSDGSCVAETADLSLNATGLFAVLQQGRSNPTACATLDGSVSITSVPQDIVYEVNYIKDGESQPPLMIAASNGILVIPNLGKGTYDQIYLSTQDCESQRVGPVSLEDPPGPTFNRSFTNPTQCEIDDGRIDLTGLPEMTMFQLNFDTVGMSVVVPFMTDASGSFTLENLGPGTYRNLQVVDQEMCVSDTFTFRLEAPGEIDASVRVTALRCSGEQSGSATVGVQGSQIDLGFSWSHDPTESDSIATNLPVGFHSVTISRPGSCTTVETFEVTSPDTLKVSIEKTDEQSLGANDGTATASVTSSDGFYAFEWSNGSSDEMLTGLAPGTYRLTVTNSNGCEAYDSVTIAPFGCPFLRFDITSRQDVVCSGDSSGRIIITPTAGTAPYTYRWSHDETARDSIIEGLAAGQYFLSITDATGCTGSSPPLTIGDENPPLMLVLDTTAVSMQGASDGTASVMVSGGSPGYVYRWSTGETNAQVSGLAAGMYSVVVTDDLGCSDSIPFTLATNECLLEVDTSLVPVSCPGSEDARMELQISAGDDAVITWSHNPDLRSPLADSLAPGDYTVTIADGASCSQEIAFSVADPAPMEISYNVTKDVTDTTLFQVEALVSGGRAPYLITWATGETGSRLSGVPRGEYSLVVVDGAGCIAIDSVVVEAPQCALSIRETITDSGCDGVSGAIDLNLVGASGGFVTIEWSDPSLPAELNIDGLSEGSYSVQVNDAGCTTRDTFEVAVESMTEPLFRASRDICQANSLFVFEYDGLAGGGMPLSITLENEEISSGFRDTLAEGSYQFSITDESGCPFDSLIVVGEGADGEYLIAPQDTQILLGNSVVLIGGVNGDSSTVTPEWRIGDSVLCTGCWSIEVAPQESRIFEFSLIGDGCTVSNFVDVFVDRRDLFFVPNAFTINGDGINDQFIIHDGRGLIREIRYLKVYERSGREVYLRENFPSNVEVEDFAEAFDDFITPAVFMYLLEVELFDGEIQILTGDFSLLR